MLEWLAIIAGFVILHQYRRRFEKLEAVATELRDTVAQLRARLAAQTGTTAGAASPPIQAPRQAPPAASPTSSAPPTAWAIPGQPIPVRPPTRSTGPTHAGARPPIVAPAAPRATMPPPPEPPAPFDWEKLIGVKLFSWIAGAALALAAVFFLRYSMDHGWLRPEIRMAIGLLTGVSLLVACELKAARRYVQTANAMDASGIAILFATVFASYALWHLVPSIAAFALLILVTGVAVLLSIRRESMFIALLGLLGGFSTPVLLSSGQDNPIGLFSYLLLLNAGLAWVAYRKRWPLLTALSMVFSTLYQWGWVMKFLSADKLPIAVGIFLLFPLFSVVALAIGNRGYATDYEDGGASPLFAHSLFAQVARVSAALPLLFSLYLATVPAYGVHFGILFGFLFCLAAGLFAVGLIQGPQGLHALGALTTVVTVAIWFETSYTASAWPWLLAIVSAFVLFYLAAPIIAARWRDTSLDGVGALAVFAAPVLLAAFPVLLAIEPRAAAPALPFGVLFALLAACAAFATFRRVGAVHYVAAFFALAAEAVWSSKYLDAAHLYSALALYGAFGLFYVGAPLAARRLKRPFTPPGAAGALTLASLALLGFIAAGPAASSALWGMALLIAVLNAGLYLESANDGMPVLSTLGAVLSWVVLAVWWRTASPSAIVPALAVMAGFAMLTMGAGAWARGRAANGEIAGGFDANVFLGLVGHVFVAFVIMRPELSLPPWPVLGALAVLDLAVIAAALYLRNGLLHLAATAATGVILMLWTTVAGRQPWPDVAVMAAGVAVALTFLTLPLARRVGARDGFFQTAAGLAALLAQGVTICTLLQPGRPSLYFLLVAQLAFVTAAIALSWIEAEKLGLFAVASSLAAAVLAAIWISVHRTPADWSRQLVLSLPVYLVFTAYPLALGRRAGDARAPYVATVLASVLFFFLARTSLAIGGYAAFIGALPVAQGLLLLPVLAQLVKMERERTGGGTGAMASDRLALVAAATLACVTVAIPLQLDKNWITIGWALEGTALVWLFRRIRHPGLFTAAMALLGTAFVRLTVNPAVLTYHARGAMPILNWYLYTYLLCSAALFAAARLVMDGEARMKKISGLLAAGGTVLLFLLVNIEIADYFATGPTITFNFNANLAQDLTYTIGWALFSLALLGAGIKLKNRPCRIASIALLAVTVAKCFLHDLGRLGGLYRVSSFVGLALCLSLVAIVLQKFVLARDEPQLTNA